jgi:hypothetical protein
LVTTCRRQPAVLAVRSFAHEESLVKTFRHCGLTRATLQQSFGNKQDKSPVHGAFANVGGD